MAETTKIEWCDATFNPWIGCTKVGPGCDHCYAEVSTPSRTRGILWGPGAQRQRTSEGNWKQVERWNAEAGRGRFVQCDGCGRREFRKWDNTLPPGGLACCSTEGCTALPESDISVVRPRVFCASLADWLDNEVPIEWLVDLLDLIRRTPNLDWLLLTKRVGNWQKRIQEAVGYCYENDRHDLGIWLTNWLRGFAPDHVWLGSTVVNQPELDRDAPKLLQVPARVRFLSIEPMLGAIEFSNVTKRADAVQQLGKKALHGIHWIIAGGESGPKARPVHPDWIRSLRAQCSAAGVKFLFKQWGAWAPVDLDDVAGVKDWGIVSHDGGVDVPDNRTPDEGVGEVAMRIAGKKAAGNLLDGRQHLEWPL
jgi:protein gp37